ncbi:MAG: peptidoglycan/xylan/chitin deacetylase (PgdA/CDA1 family) [Roseivirga sp.]|jgi:peptidoglycan/xylan/chitin deacetylase (PgdA/CDA1 family)
MLLHKTPLLLQWLYPNLVWKMKTDAKIIYLTFDDGPIPEVTPWVLNTLDKFNAKATFFCVGDNIKKYPEVFKQVVSKGHSIGNHTFSHLNGWKTERTVYLKDFLSCEQELRNKEMTSNLFRPPYGRITPKQIGQLKSRQIIMWDVLSGDFSNKIQPEQVLANSIKYSSEGSIIVFHDSLKAFKNLKYTLSQYLEHFSQQGYQFQSL